MGIDGLLQLLKPLVEQEHLSSFSGCTVGIDAFPWLYKGCYMHYSTVDLDNDRQILPSCSNFILLMLDLMATYSITPYFVFDGRSLPMKQDTITKRNDLKDSSEAMFNQLRKTKNWQEAKKYLTRTIRVTDDLVCQALTVLKLKNIKYIISPYETDSQLSKLWLDNHIDLVMTEDSDLILYGCKKLIYKITQDGVCDYLDLTDPKQASPSIHLSPFLKMEHKQKIETCVLSGCDYINNIKGVGLKKAIKLMEEHGSLQNVVVKLQEQKAFKDKIPQAYLEKAMNACLIFEYALIFNLKTSTLEHFNNTDCLKLSEGQLQILGLNYQQYVDLNIKEGECNPRTLAKRNFDTSIKIQVSTEVNSLKIKELEEKNKERKALKFQLEADKEDMIDFHILEAAETLRKPVSISQFWNNEKFEHIISQSLSKILFPTL